MKFLGWLSAIVTIVVMGIFVLGFTQIGNSIVKPMIEKQIQIVTDTDAKLDTFSLTIDNFNIILDLDDSNSIYANGNYSISSQKFNIAYKVKLDKLQNLQTFTKNKNLNGVLHTTGTAKGSLELINIDGVSNLASSDTSYHVELTNLNPTSIIAKIKKANLAEILSIVGEKKYADALVDVEVDISNAKLGVLKGTIVSKLTKGILNSNFITKEYKLENPMPKTLFATKAVTKLSGKIITTKVDFNSNLANLDIKQMIFNTDNNSLESDYLLNIPKLNKLFFITQRDILGGLKVNGKIKKAKDLDFTAYTKIASGDIEAKVHNDNLTISSKSVQTLELLHKLIYPEIFDASLNAQVNYNLATSKGTMVGDLVDGKFTQNQVFDLIKEYTNLDMYRETFKGDISADINKEHIVASLDLVGRTSSIVTKKTKIDTKENQIDSTIDINANGNPIVVKLSGETTKPKVYIDANKLIKSKATQTITKKLQEKIGDKLGVDVGNILKSFF